MLIKKIIETEDGNYEFSANVTAEEFQYFFAIGVNFLLQEGAIAVEGSDEEEEFDDPQQSFSLN